MTATSDIAARDSATRLVYTYPTTWQVGGAPAPGVRLGAIMDAADAVTCAHRDYQGRLAVTVTGHHETADAVAAATFTRSPNSAWGFATIDAAEVAGQYTVDELYRAFLASPPRDRYHVWDNHYAAVKHWLLYIDNADQCADPDNMVLTAGRREHFAWVVAYKPSASGAGVIAAPTAATQASRSSARSYTSAAARGAPPALAAGAVAAGGILEWGAAMGGAGAGFLPAAAAGLFGAAGALLVVGTPVVHLWAGRRSAAAVARPAHRGRPSFVADNPAEAAVPAPPVLALHERCSERLDWYAGVVADPVGVLLDAPGLLDPTYGLLDDVWAATTALQERFGTLFPTLPQALEAAADYSRLAGAAVDALDVAEAHARRIGFAPPEAAAVTDTASAAAVGALAQAHQRLSKARAEVADRSASAAKLAGQVYGTSGAEQRLAAARADEAAGRLADAQAAERDALAALLAAGTANMSARLPEALAAAHTRTAIGR